MFQSPLKTVTEKIKPTQSKSGISSLKFERASDFKKFIGFIKNETQELEKIKLPTRAEIEPKSKSGGLFGLLGLGLLGGLGSAFGGSGDDESNLRLGSAGGTTNQFSSGTLLTKNIRRTKNISTTRTTVGSGRVISKKLADDGARFKDKVRDEFNKKTQLQTKFKKIRDIKKKYQKSIDLTQKKFFPKDFGDADLFDDINFKDPIDADFYSAIDDFKKIKSSNISLEDSIRINKALANFEDVPKSSFGFYTEDDYKTAEKEYLKAEKIFQKDIKKGKINLFNGLIDIDLLAENPNLKIKGFSPKDFIDKQFTRAGKITKGLRGNLKNLAKTKVGGVSPMGLAKGLGKLAPVVDFGVTLPLAINELGLVDFSDGILKPKVGRDNIFTSVYDMFTAFYNAGVEGLGFDDAYKRLKISKPKDGEISGSFIPFTNIGAYKYNPRKIVDTYNEEILEARKVKKLRDAFKMTFDSSMLNDSNIQFPKSNVFSIQKPNGAEFAVPYEYSEGLYDFTMPLKIKLNKQ